MTTLKKSQGRATNNKKPTKRTKTRATTRRITMGVCCDRCNKQFSSKQYLIAHINAKSNVFCWEYYYRRREKERPVSDGERALKRQRMIERREAIIRGQKEVLLEHVLASKKLSGSLSVFDFCDESPQPKSFPRVLKPTCTSTVAASAGVEAAQEDTSIIEETEETNEMTVEGEDVVNE